MTQQFTGLQILRFVAAMLVAAMHITQAFLFKAPPPKYQNAGNSPAK